MSALRKIGRHPRKTGDASSRTNVIEHPTSVFMAESIKTTTIWVVDFRYDGLPRRWLKAFGGTVDVGREVATNLCDLYGKRVQLVEVRKATDEEVLQYLRGAEPKNVYCLNGQRRRSVLLSDRFMKK